MEFVELLSALKEQNKTGRGFQIHLNSGNLDEKAQRNTDVEVGDLYFTHYRMLHDGSILAFYDEGNSNMFIDVKKIESIEEAEDCEDWFELESSKVINLYMFPENNNVDGHRNVVSIGLMK